MFRSERIGSLLEGNYHVIRIEELSSEEIDFLANFFDVKKEEDINPETLEVQRYLVLEKKSKYVFH